MNTQNRWKSKLMWAAVASQLIILLQLVGVFKALGLDAGTVSQGITLVLGMLVTLGVLNNPTDKENF